MSTFTSRGLARRGFVALTAALVACTSKEDRVKDGYVVMDEASALYGFRTGDRLQETTAANVPASVADAAQRIIRASRGDASCSRFFGAGPYVIASPQHCDKLAEPPRVFLAIGADGAEIAPRDIDGRPLGRIQETPGMVREAVAKLCPLARDRRGRRVPEDRCT
jgi:hypothetical protein